MSGARLRRLALCPGVSGAPETFVVDGAGVALDRHYPIVLDERSLQRLLTALERAR